MVALKGEHSGLKLRGRESIVNESPKLNRKFKDNQFNNYKPFTGHRLDSIIYNRPPGSPFVNFDKAPIFDINLKELLQNDLANNSLAIHDSQRVLIHSFSFLIGFAVVIITAGIIKYIKFVYRRFMIRKLTDKSDIFIETSDISLAEWKGKQASITRIEDYEDIIYPNAYNKLVSKKSNARELESGTDSASESESESEDDGECESKSDNGDSGLT